MKWPSLLTMLNGILFLLDYIQRVSTGNPFKYGSTYLSNNFNYLELCLGIAFLLIGFGLFKKSKFAFKSSIVLYGLLIFYGVLSMSVLIIKDIIELSLIPLYLLPLLYYSFILFTLLKLKSNFR